LVATSAPLRAAMVISFTSLPKILPLALAAASLCLTFHCAPITHSLGLWRRDIYWPTLCASLYGLKLAIDQKFDPDESTFSPKVVGRFGNLDRDDPKVSWFRTLCACTPWPRRARCMTTRKNPSLSPCSTVT